MVDKNDPVIKEVDLTKHFKIYVFEILIWYKSADSSFSFKKLTS